MFRYGLGLDAPWYLAELVAIDYVSIVAFVLVLLWLAGVSQLTAIATGRYAPYPSAAERPPLGPIRSTVRTVVLGLRGRRATSDEPKGVGALGMRRVARITGTVMIVAGACSIAWVLLVWQWQDPFTAIYAKYEQHKLASSFAHRFAEYRPPAAAGAVGERLRRGPRSRRRSRPPRPRTGRPSTRASRSAA